MRSPQYASLASRAAPQSRETNSRMPRVIIGSFYRAAPAGTHPSRLEGQGVGRFPLLCPKLDEDPEHATL